MNIKTLTVISIIIILVLSSGCGAGPTAATEPPGNPATPPPTAATEAPSSPEETPSCPDLDQEFNSAKTVTLALPGFALGDSTASGVIFAVMPLEKPPAQGLDDPCGVIIGYIFAARDLPLNDSILPTLPAGEYRIKVKGEKISFINTNDEELPTNMAANFMAISSREVDPPEAIITYKDICFSWLHDQVCTEPAYKNALTESETGAILGNMQNQVDALVGKGIIDPNVINVEGTVPDMAGNDAKYFQQASLLAAPNYNFPSADGDYPIDGALLGVVYAVMNIDVDNYPSLPAGTYAVWANKVDNGWEGKFQPVDGPEIYLPATYLQMRGQMDEPLAIVVDLRIVLCWWRERC